jgi:hypothetical protein
MRKLAFAGLALAASYFSFAPAASADGAATATFAVTHATNSCTAPKAGPGQLGYACTYAEPGSKAALAPNQPSSTTLPDGRVVQLVLKEVIEPKKPGDARRFHVVASHKPSGAGSFIGLADITVKQGEAIHFRFPFHGADALLVDITLAK